ncbi:hypothetical protein ANN_09450 [Periplaneta americana]|uniref:Uncharacterized protein n=1 Tax=Periplaneta americana TaxID=6978 RepID=A0ABQ8TMC6_PERAM|nr:hypothetical protein ANN_09450 [Periplaneta americana]
MLRPEDVATAIALIDDGHSLRYAAAAAATIGAPYSKACAFSNRTTFNRGSIMVWAGISMEGRTELAFVKNGNLNADCYIEEILSEHVVLYAPFIGDEFQLMHNSVRLHTAQGMFQPRNVVPKNSKVKNEDSLSKSQRAILLQKKNQHIGRLKLSLNFTTEVIVANVLEEDRRITCADIAHTKLRPKIGQNWLQPAYSLVMNPSDYDVFPKMKNPLRDELFAMLNDLNTAVKSIRDLSFKGELSGIQKLPQCWEAVLTLQGDLDLMLDLGVIRQASVGTFHLLPLAERSLQKLITIVDVEMEKIGAQKLLLPLLTPGELWKTTVRAVLGRSQDSRCSYCHNEVETLAHVLGSCPHGESLQNARHHQVQSIIATALKDADYNTFEEVHGLSITGSTRRIDIIAFKESTRSGFIIDPTVHFKTNEEQPAEVDKEKNYLQSYHSILPPKVPARRA